MIAIILLAMMTLSGISLILNTGSLQMVESYKAQFTSKVILQHSVNAEKINPNVLLSFSESSYLDSYMYTAKAAMKSSHLEALGENEETSRMAKFYLKAFSSEDESFQQKTKVLIKGKMADQEDNVIISKELAELNQLDIDDKITLQANNNNNKIYKISGIYEDLSLKNTIETVPLMDSLNEIYINYDYFIQSDVFKNQGELDGIFYLNKPSDLSFFQKEIKAKGLPAGYDVKSDLKDYEEATAPAQSIHQVSTMFVIGIIAIGSILLLFITAFSIRERQYEIGVLRAIGMSRKHVMTTLICETLILCGSCLIVGLIIANILGPVLGDELLLKQQNSVVNLTNISFYLNGNTIGILCLIMLTAGLITSLFGVMSIMRFEPRKILSERN